MKTVSKLPLGGTPARLLEFFLAHPTTIFYESQVRRQTRLSAGTVNNHLKTLAGQGYVVLERRGNMNFYRLNRTGSIVREIKVAWNLSLPLADALRVAAKELGVKAYLYGSAARGEDVEDSDWDLLVIGTVPLTEIEGRLAGIRNKFGRKLSMLAFTETDWLAMRRKDPALYERVEKEKKELV